MENLSDRRKDKTIGQRESAPEELGTSQDHKNLLDHRFVAARQSTEDASIKTLLPQVQVVDNQEPLLPVKLSEEESSTLDALKISGKQALEIKSYINQTGKDPKEMVLAIWDEQRPRIMAFGEQHDNIQMRKFGGQIIQELKEAGATHLALELDASREIQGGLKRFQLTGDTSGIPQDLKGRKSFIEMLQEARKSGIEIIAVDKYPPANSIDRNVDMSKNVMNYLDKDPHNRIVLWLGALHIARDNATPNCLDYLSKKYKTCRFISVNHQLNLSYLTEDLQRPVMIPLVDSPMAKLPISTVDEEYAATKHDDFDYALFLPKQKQ